MMTHVADEIDAFFASLIIAPRAFVSINDGAERQGAGVATEERRSLIPSPVYGVIDEAKASFESRVSFLLS